MVPESFVRAMDGFEAVLAAVPASSERWEARSPCEDWCAVEVAGHLIAGLLGIHARATGRPLDEIGTDLRALAGDDPPATWRKVRADTMAALGPEALDRPVDLPWEGEMSLRDFVARYPLELLIHTWDFAQATGQVVVLDPEGVREALETAKQFAPVGRQYGMVGPERPVPADADDQTRLLALFGRDVRP